MRRVAVLVLILFAVAGLLRLNPFCLLEPDGPEYLFTSRSLATLGGYVEIDHPGRPLHTFRPPGLALLLAPLSLFRPFDVTGAKVVLLALAVLLLWQTLLLGTRVAGPRSGLVALALVATSPYLLLHATEVVTEIPFLVVVLGVLLVLSRSEGSVPIRTVLLGGTLLAILPFFRTIGLALLVAVLLWSLLGTGGRRVWLVAAALAAIPSVLWSVRNLRAGGPTPFGSIVSDYSRSEPAAYALRLLLSGRGEIGRLCGVLLPGTNTGPPLYERFLIGESASFDGPLGLAILLALIAVTVAIVGMVSRRRREGAVVLIYLVVYLLVLTVYPPKHERLAWPLVPLVWIYLPAGIRHLDGRDIAPMLWRPVRTGILATGAALCLWQAMAVVSIVRTNVLWRLEGDLFYERVPPVYYAGWQGAGRWIAENTPPHARVLTRHSDTGFTSGRFQDSIRFEEQSPVEWRARLARLGARYMVVPTTLFGRLFYFAALGGDPVYTYTPVYEADDVTVLEVGPNRSGVVRPAPPDLSDTIERCRNAIEAQPDRVDLKRRLGEMLSSAGRGDEAVAFLRAAIDRHGPNVGLYCTLGEALLAVDRPEEALTAFATAAFLPGSDRLTRSLRRGVERARRALEPGGEHEATDLLDSARWKMRILDYPGALEDARRAVELAPDRPGRYVLARVLERLGRVDEARAQLERASGYPEATERLAMLDVARDVGHGDDATDDDLLLLSRLFIEDGVPGRALALLERATASGRDAPDLLAALARVYLYYGIAEEAAPLYRRVLEADPTNETARRGLERSLDLLRTR